MKGEVAAFLIRALKHLFALCRPFHASEEEMLYRFLCPPTWALIRRCCPDLIYIAVQSRHSGSELRKHAGLLS
jgi:hypothetical protein